MAAFEYKGVCCRCKTAEVVCPPVMDPDWTPEEQADVRAGWEETRVELEADTPEGDARRIAFIRALMENLMCKPCATAQIHAALQDAVRQQQEQSALHPVVSDGLPACDIRGCRRQSCGYAEVALCNPDGSAIPLTSTIVLSDGRRQPASEPTRLWICAQHAARAEETGLQGMQVAFTVDAAPPEIILAEAPRKRPTTDAEIAEACANGQQHCTDCRVTTCCDNTNVKEKARVAREKNHAGDIETLTPDEMKALGKFNTVERLTGDEMERLRALRGGA